MRLSRLSLCLSVLRVVERVRCIIPLAVVLVGVFVLWLMR